MSQNNQVEDIVDIIAGKGEYTEGYRDGKACAPRKEGKTESYYRGYDAGSNAHFDYDD